jgi:hypothetical protein
MRCRLSNAVGLIALGGLTLGAGPAQAQTTANGPYYATPSWNQQLPATTRFIVLANWNNEAVLDRETGLVWQKSPFTQTVAGGRTWQDALATCVSISVGNRLGWRLPTIQELVTLVDPTILTGFTLPSGHPFAPLFTSAYWSATTGRDPLGFAVAWILSLNPSTAAAFPQGKGGVFGVWCVRGGSGIDTQ